VEAGGSQVRGQPQDNYISLVKVEGVESAVVYYSEVEKNEIQGQRYVMRHMNWSVYGGFYLHLFLILKHFAWAHN
jgi:hypothetical protein